MTKASQPPLEEVESKEAMTILGYRNPSTISRLVRDGKLVPTRLVNGGFMFDRSKVEEMAAARRRRIASQLAAIEAAS